jgi:hypothetical protein
MAPLGVAFLSLPFPSREAGDLMNIRAVDADVVKLAVRIPGQLLQDAPVGPTGAQEARKREHLHSGLSFF